MLEAPRGHVVIGLREGLPFLGEREFMTLPISQNDSI